MSKKYNDLWKEKTLEEIDALLSKDSEFHVYYLMRANYNIRRCQNEAIRSCEIRYVANRIICNLTRHNLHDELKDQIETLRKILQQKTSSNENDLCVMCKKILSDFEKASEIFQREFKFSELLNTKNIDSIQNSTNPASSFEYVIRARYIGGRFATTVIEITNDFKRSLELNSNNFMALSYYGQHLIEENIGEMNGTINGIMFIFLSREIEPTFQNNYVQLGSLYDEKKMYEEGICEYSMAAEVLESVAELDDYFTEGASLAYCLRGLSYHRMEEKELSLRDFTKGIELFSKSAAAFLGRAAINLEIGRYEESILDYTEAIKLGDIDLDGCYVGRDLAVQCWKELIMKS